MRYTLMLCGGKPAPSNSQSYLATSNLATASLPSLNINLRSLCWDLRGAGLKMLNIYTTKQIMSLGLEYVGFDQSRQRRVKESQKLKWFNDSFGTTPVVCAHIWIDLLTTSDDAARIKPGDKIKYFLMCLNWMRCYQTESVLEGLWKVSAPTIRIWNVYFATKLQALKAQKVCKHVFAAPLPFACLINIYAQIVWPENVDNGPTFMFTVDGTHCPTFEPKHPIYNQDKAYFSYKFNQAAFNYEIAISVFENKVLWVDGPHAGSKHDITIFREKLMAKVPAGKRGIADNGYKGEPTVLCTPNTHDPKELRQFKSRARARQESFNKRTKNFKCLSTDFRHGIIKHKVLFEAICVILQYELENGKPLFDV